MNFAKMVDDLRELADEMTALASTPSIIAERTRLLDHAIVLEKEADDLERKTMH